MRIHHALLSASLAACAVDDPSAVDVEPYGGSVVNTTNRWYDNNNLITVFTPVLANGTRISDAHWAKVWDAMQTYNSDTAIRMVAGCPNTDATHPPTCSPSDNTKAHLLFVDAGTVTGRTYSRTNLTDLIADSSNPTEQAEALAFQSWLPFLHTANASHHEDFIIGFRPGATITATIVEHETGHSIGLIHEQQRTDAYQYMAIYECCHTAGFDAPFAQVTNSVNLERYDLTSMMQYDSTGFAANGCYPMLSYNSLPGVADVIAGTYAACGPEPTNSSQPRYQYEYIITTPGEMSAGDRNTIYQMYSPQLDAGAAGDKYGAASAAGDFDGDGYTDLAIGAPGDGASGKVFVYKGTFTGLVPWRLLAPGDGTTNSQFGIALAAGDVDDDGMADLAIGAPNVMVAGTAGAGKLWVFHGDIRGPRAGAAFTLGQLGLGVTPQNADRLGGVLAAGDFDHDGNAELALGIPARHRVFIVRRTADWPGPAFDHFGDWGGSATADFGAALAAGDLDGDVFADLVIGGPSIDNRGKVFVTHGSATGFASITGAPNPLTTPDAFGAAVAIARVGSGRRIVVGAPAWNASRGRVVLLAPDLTVENSLTIASFAGVNGTNGRFGAAVAAGDTDSSGVDHLVIGAPGANGGAGIAGLFLRSGAAYQAGNFFSRWTGDQPGINYGGSLAIGNFDGRGPVDIAVGEPGWSSTTGEAWIIHGIDGAAMDYIAEDPNVNWYDNYATDNTTHLFQNLVIQR